MAAWRERGMVASMFSRLNPHIDVWSSVVSNAMLLVIVLVSWVFSNVFSVLMRRRQLMMIVSTIVRIFRLKKIRKRPPT